MKPLKEALGIDISKDSLAVCFGRIDQQQRITILAEKTFANSVKGFEALVDWTDRLRQEGVDFWYLMEATGVYYQNLAYYLADQDASFCVMLPNAVKQFARSTSIKTKTDRVDARILCRLALERRHERWEASSELMRELKSLVREHQSVSQQRVQLRNRREALRSSYKPSKQAERRLTQQIALCNKQLAQISEEITELLSSDTELSKRVEKLQTITGVGLLTVATVLAETDGFAHVHSVKQVVSYAGLDIVESQSGTIQKRAHISKRGNRRLRTSLYMPALAAIRCDAGMRRFYQRVCQNNGGQKKPGIIAVARKLLRIIYALWSKNEVYNPALV